MLEAYDQTQLFPTECQTHVVSFCLTKPSPWPAKRRSNHFQIWMKRSTKSWTSIQSVSWKCLTLKLKHPLLSRFLLTRTEAKVSHAMSSRESQGTPITSFRIRLDVGQRLPSKQVNQCIQDAGGFHQRCKNFEGTRTPLYPLYILDRTVFHIDMLDAESMAKQESNRMVGQKAATPSQRADPLIHKMGSSMALLQSKKAASSIAPTEWFWGFRL